MNDQPSDNAPGEQETKPSLLATVSLMLSLVPWVMVVQQYFGHELRWLPRWMRAALTFRSGFWLLVILGAVLSSVICGFMALVAMKRDKLLQGKWKAEAGGILTACFLVFIVLLLPARQTAHEKARAASCPSNLKAISTAITLSSDDDPEGKMPATLDELMNGKYMPIGSTANICPECKTPYVYPGAGRIWQSNATEISVYCRCDHDGKHNVLFNDGRFAKLPFAEFKQRLAAMGKSDGSAGER